MNTLRTIAASVTVTSVIVLGLAWLYIERAQPTIAVPASSQHIEEDDPSWDCRIDGNRICGVGTELPGCYNDHADLVAPWPCRVVVNPDGSSDVYTDQPPMDYGLPTEAVVLR